jgi:2-iminobutanoate/2-iminopropanoate deaminase
MEDINMTRQVISTHNAPKPGGPYSQGIRWDQLIFTAGLVGSDPATGQPVSDNVHEQTRQVLHNVQAVLQAAGSDLQHVLKTTCFLADIGDFATFNEVYREFFPIDPPARSTIQVGLAPPWRVEIEVIAVRSSSA